MTREQTRAVGVWLLNLVELPCPLQMGASIGDEDGRMAKVYEVRRLQSLSSPVAGENRELFAVLHAGGGSIIVAVCLHGTQTEWRLPPCAISMGCLCAGHARDPAASACDTSESGDLPRGSRARDVLFRPFNGIPRWAGRSRVAMERKLNHRGRCLGNTTKRKTVVSLDDLDSTARATVERINTLANEVGNRFPSVEVDNEIATYVVTCECGAHRRQLVAKVSMTVGGRTMVREYAL